MQARAGLPIAKSTEDRRGTARNAVDLPFAKSTEKIRVYARNAVDQLSAKILEILYAKTFQIEKAEDFAPVALFIHFQMNHLAEISRPRKTW
jgi:hypothetical protein